MRVSEWVIAVFFAWTTALALSLPISGQMRTRTLLANAAVLLAYVALLRVQQHEWAQTVRDWFPQALMILAYKQMGWFAPETHTNYFENQWIVWDRILLDDMHGRKLIESLGPVLPSVLEFCYALVYAVPPITMLVIYSGGCGSAQTRYSLSICLACSSAMRSSHSGHPSLRERCSPARTCQP